MSTTEVEVTLLHPRYPTSGRPYSAQHREFVASPEFQTFYGDVIHHADEALLRADLQRVEQHAATVLESHGSSKTLPVLITVTPCIPHDDFAWYGGIFGLFQSDRALNKSQIHLFWSNTDLSTLLTVLTHELGHHLRASEIDDDQDNDLRCTRQLLHEGAAECLVAEVHGPQAMHHDRPIDQNFAPYLPRLLDKELYGNSLDAHDQRLWETFPKSHTVYPFAVDLMKKSGLGFRDLATIPVQVYLARIRPLVEPYRSLLSDQDTL